MSLSVLVTLLFVAVSLAALAVGLVVRDLLASRGTGQPSALDEFVDLPPRRHVHNPIDRWFYDLIDEAGRPCSPATLLSLVAGGALVGAVAGLVAVEHLPAAVFGLACGAGLPIAGLWVLRARRLATMRRHLSDTLELLADGVRAGQSLEQAAELVARQGVEPLASEFAHCAAQLRLGQSAVAVLERMVLRVPLPEFKMFAVATTVHRQTGGKLALLIDRMALAARERHNLRGHVQAVTAGSRLSAVGLLGATAVAVALLAAMQPEYLDVFVSHPWGQPLVAMAAGLQIAGILWVSRILKVDI